VGRYQVSSSTKGKKHWVIIADEYVAASIKNVDVELGKVGRKLATCVDCVISQPTILKRISRRFWDQSSTIIIKISSEY
jgi:hypothetical protein